MIAKERHKFFKLSLTRFREICAEKKIAVGERKFFDFIQTIVSEREWDAMAPKIDRVAAQRPHHNKYPYDKVSDLDENKIWLASRYLFMFGPRKCETCGATKGPLFRPLEGVGTGLKGSALYGRRNSLEVDGLCEVPLKNGLWAFRL